MKALQGENKKLKDSLHELNLNIAEFNKTANAGLTRANENKTSIGIFESRVKKLE